MNINKTLKEYQTVFIRLWYLSMTKLFALIIVLLCLLTVLSQIIFSFLDYTKGVEYILLFVFLFWSYLFKNAPKQIYLLYKHKKQLFTNDGWQSLIKHKVANVSVETEAGIGIFAPSKKRLNVDGKLYFIDHLPEQAFPIGKAFIISTSHANVLLDVQEYTPIEQNDHGVKSELSDAEVRILQCIQNKLPDKLIARELDLSPSTIRSYNSHLFKKLSVDNRQDAVKVAIAKGLL
jgi:DNA-binding CsgD family transcriptional regulator